MARRGDWMELGGSGEMVAVGRGKTKNEWQVTWALG